MCPRQKNSQFKSAIMKYEEMKCHCREHASTLDVVKQECTKPHPETHVKLSPVLITHSSLLLL